MDTIQKEKKNISIFVADDDHAMRGFVSETLLKEGYTVTEYDPINPEPSLLKKTYDVAILDICMPETNGFELRRQMLSYSAATQFIIMTGYPDQEKYTQSIEIEAFSFILKPFHAEQIRYAVMGAVTKQQYQQREFIFHDKNGDIIDGLVGTSGHIKDISRRIKELAPIEIPILITGESGTGKEIVARNIHDKSNRTAKPFVAINCGGLTPSLIESELFGHIQGAFTGASKTKHGLFHAAEGGTLFLDEIGELPLELQSKFLRILDTGEYYRVGESTPQRCNVRVVSATNKNLEEMISAGTFRPDLFFRLRGGLITLKPLRDRDNDVMLLINHFLEDEYSITPAALKIMQKFDWPGNVRELAMIVKTLSGMCRSKTINEELVHQVLGVQYGYDLSAKIDSYRASKSQCLKDFEVKYFSNLMKLANGNMSRAAEAAEMDRKNLREKLKQLDLYEKK